MEQSQLTAARLLKEPLVDDAARLERVYRLVLGRGPNAAERTIALDYLAQGEDTAAAWSALVQSLFASPDFRYVE
jgi:hypothetical protein